MSAAQDSQSPDEAGLDLAIPASGSFASAGMHAHGAVLGQVSRSAPRQ